MEKIIYALIFVAVICGGMLTVTKAIDAQEQVDCLKWAQQAMQYDQFYLLQWQADQCSHWDIEVNAPVHE